MPNVNNAERDTPGWPSGIWIQPDIAEACSRLGTLNAETVKDSQ